MSANHQIARVSVPHPSKEDVTGCQEPSALNEYARTGAHYLLLLVDDDEMTSSLYDAVRECNRIQELLEVRPSRLTERPQVRR